MPRTLITAGRLCPSAHLVIVHNGAEFAGTLPVYGREPAPGSAIAVQYDPANPATMARATSNGFPLAIGGLVLGIGLVLLMIAFSLRKRGRSSVAAASVPADRLRQVIGQRSFGRR